MADLHSNAAIRARLEAFVETRLGAPLATAQRLHGGDLSVVWRVSLADQRSLVVKTGPSPRTEAAMLAALTAAGARCPKALTADDAFLALEDLGDERRLGRDGAEALGEMLARIHNAPPPGAAGYGWAEKYAFGAVAIPNGWEGDWPRFWAEKRLLATLEHAPSAIAQRVESLAQRLPELLPVDPTPALLHGDLWSGNVFGCADGAPALIDPAAYYGDREVDLAMLTLFGAPDPAFFEAYGALSPGAASRRPIYQLWPALMHLRLFGGGYARLVDDLLQRIGF